MTSTHDFALTAARKYLQSIVFVDDEIYLPVSVRADTVDLPSAATAMKVFAKPIQPMTEVGEKAPSSSADQGGENTPNNGGHYHPKYLVESFARERMVCALYEPEENFPTDANSELFKLCERADAVILDWEFHKEPGTKVKELLTGLVSAAQTAVPHHVRLCAVYTSTPDLKRIASQLFEHLDRSGLCVEVAGEYGISAGSSRIIILGKPTTGRPQDQAKVAEVAEKDLAGRIIKEFATMHEGILPSMALQGLASVRTNAKKILDKFHKELDGAFLVHRGLILPGDDAFEQIPELLAEEALAVMSDNWIGHDDAKALAEIAVDGMNIQTAWIDKNGSAGNPGQQAVQLLKKGPGKVGRKVELSPENLDVLHVELDPHNTLAKERLATLYSSRTQYGAQRSLQFGTIIRYNVCIEAEGICGEHECVIGSRYAICLMPLCDCVRLKPDRWYQFPFWELRTNNHGASSKGIVVELPGGSGFVELFSMGKPRDQLWLDEFQAGSTKMVVARNEIDKFIFKSRSAKSFDWIAQLKPNHAQRIAHDIGNSFSRVGVLEAEWLRLKADRQ